MGNQKKKRIKREIKKTPRPLPAKKKPAWKGKRNTTQGPGTKNLQTKVSPVVGKKLCGKTGHYPSAVGGQRKEPTGDLYPARGGCRPDTKVNPTGGQLTEGGKGKNGGSLSAPALREGGPHTRNLGRRKSGNRSKGDTQNLPARTPANRSYAPKGTNQAPSGGGGPCRERGKRPEGKLTVAIRDKCEKSPANLDRVVGVG